MEIAAMILIIIYGLIGGLSTLVLALGLPAILAWKIYRRVKFQIPLTK